MIRFIWSRIMKWGWDYGRAIKGTEIRALDHIDGIDIERPESLRLTTLRARGGTVVQVRSYNRKSDNNDYITFVIPDGADVAEEIGKIVNMELLKS